MTPFLAALTLVQSPINRPWESEVFYQIFPRSYRDSNGDGHGDFKGIEQGLDSIVKLGATTILINPVYKARVYHNYFADDWFDTDPRFGSLADFRHLCDTAHAKGIRIVLDMENQYLAEGHPWFQSAMGNPSAVETKYFTGQPKKGSAATSPWFDRIPLGFSAVDLNQPVVQAEVSRNYEFWLAQGVDGFRIDHMMDDLDWTGKVTGLYKNLWSPIIVKSKQTKPGTFFIGEQAEWDSFRASLEVFSQTPADATFNFRLFNAFASLKRIPMEKGLNEYQYFVPGGRVQANFLENHDTGRFASLNPDLAQQRAAAAILMAAKGIPSIYYGQELGMRGIQGNWSSDGNDIPVRLGYRWGKALRSAGTPYWYAGTGPWATDRFSKDGDGIDYASQDKDPKSLLNWYRKLIHIRIGNESLRTGTQKVFDAGKDQVLGVTRASAKGEVRILANLSNISESIDSPVKGASKDLISGKSYATSKLKLEPWQVIYLVSNTNP